MQVEGAMFSEVSTEYSLFNRSERYYMYYNTNWITVQLLDISEGSIHYLLGHGGFKITANSYLCVSTTWHLYYIATLYHAVPPIETNYKIFDLWYVFVIDLYEVIIRCRNLKGIEKGG